VPRPRAVRERVDIWPGFVDALSTLLMVVIFLLAIFVLAQFFLGRLLQRSDVTVERLRAQVAELERRLAEERAVTGRLRREIARLSSDLDSLLAGREEAEARLAAAAADREVLERRVARLTGSLREMEARLGAAEAARREVEARAARLETALAETRRTLEATRRAGAEREAGLEARIRELEAERARIERERQQALVQVATLSRQIRELGRQLRQLAAALDVREEEIARQAEVIRDLGARLNLALARKVEELSRYRSDFFGRLREVLGDRPDVRVVGDRFVFQSEILFDTGSAELNPEGRRQLETFVRVFREIMPRIPEDLPWVLQVDGHTDKRPIRTPRFPSNWELSTARAIAVARFLIEHGIPPERVAARGFAHYQPLDPRDTEEAYRRNRRIEIKLTTR